MGFSFTMGLWLYRVRAKGPKLRLGWFAATAILVALFMLPLVPKSVPHGNGLYQATLVMLVFPLLILTGAHSEIGPREMALCKLAGRLSYPIYMLHYPFLYLYMNYVTFRKPEPGPKWIAAIAVFSVVMLFSWLALTFYDEPIRRSLKGLTRGT
jgi:peptidoglycan/LPS O-acetylase OafA/YrhL